MSQEFDRVCALYFREWEDEREEYRLKRVLNWFMGGDKKEGKRAKCEHGRFEPVEGGGLKCLDCGEVGN